MQEYKFNFILLLSFFTTSQIKKSAKYQKFRFLIFNLLFRMHFLNMVKLQKIELIFSIF